MSQNFEERIAQFENTYLKQLQLWSGMVAPEELDKLNDTMSAMTRDSTALTRALKEANSALFQKKWQPLVERAACMIPSVIAQVERVKNNAREKMGALGKGSRGIKGYRQTAPTQRTYFESEG